MTPLPVTVRGANLKAGGRELEGRVWDQVPNHFMRAVSLSGEGYSGRTRLGGECPGASQGTGPPR